MPTYDSPKTLRRRQRATEGKAAKRRAKRAPQAPKTFTDPDWLSACDFHVGRIQEEIAHGRAESASRHAEAIVHCAVTRKAMEMMANLNLRTANARTKEATFWAAMDAAKEELFDGEVA